MNRDDEFLDGSIDRALESYAASEPRAGLEYRLLARASSQVQSRSWRPALAWAAAMLMLAAAALPLELKWMRTRPANGVTVARLASPPAIAAADPVTAPREYRRPAAASRRKAGENTASAHADSLIGGEKYFADMKILLQPIRMEPIELAR